MAAPTIRQILSGVSIYSSDATHSITVNLPATAKKGDLLALAYGLDYGVPNQTDSPPPAGVWTLRATAVWNGDAAPNQKLWTRYLAQDGAQSVTLSHNDPLADAMLVGLLIADPHPTNPVSAVSINWANAASAHVALGITPTDPDELLAGFYLEGISNNDIGNYAAPTGMTKQVEVDASPFGTMMLATQQLSSAAATGNKTATFTRSTSTSTQVRYTSILIGFRGKPASVTRETSSAISLSSVWTASKSVSVQVDSPVELEETEEPEKTVQLATESPVELNSQWAATKDVLTLPAGGPIDLSVWVVDAQGNHLGVLPDAARIELSPVVNAPGGVRISYPTYGENFGLLHDGVLGDRDTEIAIWIGGREQGSLRAILNEAAGDESAEVALWDFTGYFLEGRMTEAVVWPNPSDEKKETHFAAATAGTIMAQLMSAAHGRGALADIGYGSFTSVLGSNGVPFSKVITITLSPGADYLKVLGDLVDYGLIDWEITPDHQLRIYEQGSLGRDLTEAYPPVVLRVGKDLTDSPRQHSLRDTATALLASGKDGIYIDESDPIAESRRGRRIESYVSQASIDAEAALHAYAQAELSGVSKGTMSLSQGLAFAEGGPLPVADYKLHDWVYSDNGNGNERYRVAQWTIQQDEHGQITGSTVLNDAVANWRVNLARRLAALEGGTTVVGTSTPSTQEDDVTPPAAPTGVVGSSIPYQNPDIGTTEAVVRVGWLPVQFNADGTVCDDLDAYRVRWRYLGLNVVNNTPAGELLYGTGEGAWQYAGDTNSSALTHDFGGVAAGVDIEVAVSAVDRAGNESAWSAVYGFTTASDIYPPPVASIPEASSYLGTIRLGWDGLTAAGDVMTTVCVDFDHVEVHLSEVNDFTPDESTLVGRLFGASATVITDLPYNVVQHARLVAVDRAGNKAEPSGDAVAVATQLIEDDVFDGAIGEAKLADLAVSRAKIADLAVNDAKIANLSVGKLQAGLLTAEVILGGSIKTGLTGARIEMDAVGFRQYNESGALRTQFVAATGDALVTGTIRSAMSGKRWEMQPDGSLRLYPATGNNYSQMANYGNDVVWRGPLDANGFGSRMNINLEGIGVNYSRETNLTQLLSEMVLRKDDIRLRSPLVTLTADAFYAPNGGGRNRIAMMFTNASTGVVDPANTIEFVQDYWSDGPSIWASGRNLQIQFNNAGKDSFRFTYNDGGYADIWCGLVNGIVVTTSSETSKENLEEVTYEPLDLIRATPVSQFQYKADLERKPRPDKPGTKVPRKKPGVPEESNRVEDFEWVDAEWQTPADPLPPAPKHVGPMADDILTIAPDMVMTRDDGTLGVFLQDQVGIMWKAIQQLADKLDDVTDKFPDIPALPGRKPPKPKAK